VRPVNSSLKGSTGTASPIREAAWADVTVAASTNHEHAVPRQLFYIAPNDGLYDALIGNGTTLFGPLRSHVDGQDHRYYYTAALGHRHSLPMVARPRQQVAAPTGAATAFDEAAEQLYVFCSSDAGASAHMRATGAGAGQ
jgi:hypothetical protein